MLKCKAQRSVSKIERYMKYGFAITEYERHYCPRCGNVLNAGPNYQPKYCERCGQKVSFEGIKWGEEKTLGYAERRVNFEQIEKR